MNESPNSVSSQPAGQSGESDATRTASTERASDLADSPAKYTAGEKPSDPNETPVVSVDFEDETGFFATSELSTKGCSSQWPHAVEVDELAAAHQQRIQNASGRRARYRKLVAVTVAGAAALMGTGLALERGYSFAPESTASAEKDVTDSRVVEQMHALKPKLARERAPAAAHEKAIAIATGAPELARTSVKLKARQGDKASKKVSPTGTAAAPSATKKVASPATKPPSPTQKFEPYPAKPTAGPGQQPAVRRRTPPTNTTPPTASFPVN